MFKDIDPQLQNKELEDRVAALEAHVANLERFITEGEEWDLFIAQGNLTKHIQDTVDYNYYVSCTASLERSST